MCLTTVSAPLLAESVTDLNDRLTTLSTMSEKCKLWIDANANTNYSACSASRYLNDIIRTTYHFTGVNWDEAISRASVFEQAKYQHYAFKAYHNMEYIRLWKENNVSH